MSHFIGSNWNARINQRIKQLMLPATVLALVFPLIALAANKENGKVVFQIKTELKRNRGKSLDLSRLKTAKPWDRFCIFGPHTTNAMADRVLGVAHWRIESHSRIAKSKDIDTLIFVNSKHKTVVYTIELSRKVVDLSFLSSKCFQKEVIPLPK